MFAFLNKRKIGAIAGCGTIAALGTIVYLRLFKLWEYDTNQEDIYYIWLEGKRILTGENPYARILAGNMRENQKYATYFSLFYYFSALTQLRRFREYESWISLWRAIFLIFNLRIANLLSCSTFKLRYSNSCQGCGS